MNTSDTAEVNPTISPERQSIGKFLRRFAWAFEIAAVTIGLAISLATVMANFHEMSSYRPRGLQWGDWANIFIAALPFVMVAMVELTKIPLVGVFYKASSRRWKWVFGACLLFVAGITFESAFNGFERNFSALMYAIENSKKEVVTLDQKLEKLDADRVRLTSMTLESIEKEYNDRYSELFKQTDTQKQTIQGQIDTLRASIKSSYVTSLREELTTARDERTRLIADKSNEIERITNRFANESQLQASERDSIRRSLQAQLNNATSKLSSMETTSKQEIDDASIFSRGTVRQEWKQKIDQQNELIKSLRQKLNSGNVGSTLSNVQEEEQNAKQKVREEYDTLIRAQDSKIQRLNREISRSLSGKEKEIEKSVSVYQGQINDIDKEFKSQVDVMKATRDENYGRLDNNEALVAVIDKEADDLRNLRIELVQTINEKVAGNQIYRIATWTTNKDSAADVDRSVVGLVAALWFGSLAAMIALMGVFLALGSYVILDPKQQESRNKPSLSALGKLLRARRAYYNAKRKETFTREKIVEVDKVVFKEVPVEVVKKEIVYLPFYTNDRQLLNMKLDEQPESKGEPNAQAETTAAVDEKDTPAEAPKEAKRD